MLGIALVRTIARSFPLAIVAASAVAQPSIGPGAIVNAASYAAAAMPNAGIAPGSLFIVFGNNMGAAGLHTAAGFPLPIQLNGSSMRVTVQGVTVQALMVYVSPEQVCAILPSSTPPGNGMLTLAYNNRESQPEAMRVVAARFGIFTRNSAGTGPALVQNVNSGGQPLNTLTEPALPGQTVVLWGTGLGAARGNEAGGPLPGDLNTGAEVLVGGRSAQVLYGGRSGCCAGLDEIMFVVPQGVEGCYVPVAVNLGGATSNFSSMSIAAGSQACSDATGLSAADLHPLAAGGELRVGSVELFRATITLRAPGTAEVFSATQDIGAAGFYRFTQEAAYNAQGMLGVALRGATGMPPFASCQVYPLPNADFSGIPDPTSPGLLNAGSEINVSGTPGRKQMTGTDPAGVYSGALGGAGALDFAGQDGSPAAPYLEPGIFNVDNGAGATAVGPFRASITVPNAVKWTNAEQLTTVNRGKPLTVTWTGGNAAKEFVVVAGISSNSSTNVGGVFVCTQRADAGSFTVPWYILSALPAGNAEDLISGLLWIGNVSLMQQNRFSASGLDAGYLYYTIFQFQNATFQ